MGSCRESLVDSVMETDNKSPLRISKMSYDVHHFGHSPARTWMNKSAALEIDAEAECLDWKPIKRQARKEEKRPGVILELSGRQVSLRYECSPERGH